MIGSSVPPTRPGSVVGLLAERFESPQQRGRVFERLLKAAFEAHPGEYGSPLHRAIERLRAKHDKPSGIVDDPNGWHGWAGEPFNLIRHLRRLVTVSVETARIVAALPPSLPSEAP